MAHLRVFAPFANAHWAIRDPLYAGTTPPTDFPASSRTPLTEHPKPYWDVKALFNPVALFFYIPSGVVYESWMPYTIFAYAVRRRGV